VSDNSGANATRTHLVEDLKTGVVAEDVERRAVRLPEEPEPGSDEGPVGPVPALLLTDTAQEDALGRLAGLEVLDVGNEVSVRVGGLLGGALELLDLGECLRQLVARLLEELLDDYLDTSDRGILSDVLVHVESLLGRAALAKVDTESEELDEDGLEGVERGRPEALRGEDLGDGREGSQGLVDGEELIAALGRRAAKALAFVSTAFVARGTSSCPHVPRVYSTHSYTRPCTSRKARRAPPCLHDTSKVRAATRPHSRPPHFLLEPCAAVPLPTMS
jgi:hypothetical protein